MKRNKLTLHPFLIACLVAVLVQACLLTGNRSRLPSQTKILRVRVQPDTVAPGDTASFTCVIKDSSDKRFKFNWAIDSGRVLGAAWLSPPINNYISDVNHIRWVAPTESKKYFQGVNVFDGSKDSSSVDAVFSIVVK